jgi:hypothetical protein
MMTDKEKAMEALALTDKGEEVETTKAPEAEIALNPEALKVQYQAQGQAVLTAALEFMRRQGSSTTVIVDIIAYKAFRDEVRGFAALSYELQLETMLTSLHGETSIEPPSADPSPDSSLPQEGTAPVEDPSPVAQG